jgi:DNA-3-methyladenine glycosylase
MASPDPLARAFYARGALEVARDLVGCRLVHRLPDGDTLVLRLVEVEAYLGDGNDPASHAHRGPTARNRTMFGPPGHLYAYRSYGIHVCVNVVCEAEGVGAAVLLRAGEPVQGAAHMSRLRGLTVEAAGRRLASGPGRLAAALGLELAHDGRSLLEGPLTIHPRAADEPAPRVETGPRVGITKAALLPYRLFDAASPAVSPFRSGGHKRRPGPPPSAR